jgi:pimeloyl-ACP methyl ester carboxylesterase
MPTADDLPIILLPGIGTDARLFALQRLEFPQLVVPEWLPPLAGELLPDYAARLAAAINPNRPCLVGGHSFGGMVALELARHLPAVGCVLISSVKSARELPHWMRVLGPLAWLLPRQTNMYLNAFGTLLRYTVAPLMPRRGRQLGEQLRKVRSPLIPWALRVVAKWRPEPGSCPCPVWQLHGDADFVFPLRFTHADRVVPGGGHLLPLSHPYVVNEFVRGCAEECTV